MVATKKKSTNGNGGGGGGLTAAQMHAMSVIIERAALSSRLGKSFKGRRDIYESLGYNRNPTFQDFLDCYLRQDIAKAIIDRPVRACWRKPPIVRESDEVSTDFEEAWKELLVKHRIFYYLRRLDRLGGIGHFALLLMGFDGGGDLEVPVDNGPHELLYLAPYSEGSVQVTRYVESTSDPKYGSPEIYTITVSDFDGATSQVIPPGKPIRVHASRVIHIAEDPMEGEFVGTPRLLAVLNRLQDLNLVAGGSAEMFWRGAFPGYAFLLEKDAILGTQDEAKLEVELDQYMHDLQRYIRGQGLNIQELAMQVADPSQHVDMLMDLIAGASGIPKRVLLGSERGELASTMDHRNWAERVEERRNEHCEPMILRPFIDRLISAGVLPEPSPGYTIEWPDLLSPSDRERAEVGEVMTRAVKNYVLAYGADSVIPQEVFLREFLGMNEDKVDRVRKAKGGEINTPIPREEPSTRFGGSRGGGRDDGEEGES